MPYDAGARARIRRFHSHPFLPPVAVTIVFLVGGCGTLENGRGWGQDALWPVDLDRVARAGRDALFHPATWVPLAGAAIFAIDDFDERVSDWAVKHNPIFGSEEGADDASDYLRDILRVEAVITALATPSGDTPSEWAVAKLKGLTVELGATAATSGLTSVLKDETNRERPDGSDDESFPSGHSSTSFSYLTSANRNLESIAAPAGLAPFLQTSNAVVAVGVGWARVEAQRHFPSDVLAGAALGHFVTAFIHDAFMNLPQDGHVDFTAVGLEDGVGLELCIRF